MRKDVTAGMSLNMFTWLAYNTEEKKRFETQVMWSCEGRGKAMGQPKTSEKPLIPAFLSTDWLDWIAGEQDRMKFLSVKSGFCNWLKN